MLETYNITQHEATLIDFSSLAQLLVHQNTIDVDPLQILTFLNELFMQNEDAIVFYFIHKLPNELIVTIFEKLLISTQFSIAQTHNIIKESRHWLESNGIYNEVVTNIAHYITSLDASNLPNYTSIINWLLNNRDCLADNIVVRLHEIKEEIVIYGFIAQIRDVLINFPNNCQNDVIQLYRKLSRVSGNKLIKFMANLFYDANLTPDTMQNIFMQIVYIMLKSQDVRQKCMNIIEMYSTSCGDGARIALIMMYQFSQCNNIDIQLTKALSIARYMQQVQVLTEYVAKNVINQNIESVEVALGLLLLFQESGILQPDMILMDSMLFKNISMLQIKQSNINIHQLQRILLGKNPEQEYLQLIFMFPSIEIKFNDVFTIMQIQGESLCNKFESENDYQYNERVKQVKTDFYANKLNYIVFLSEVEENEIKIKNEIMDLSGDVSQRVESLNLQLVELVACLTNVSDSEKLPLLKQIDEINLRLNVLNI